MKRSRTTTKSLRCPRVYREDLDQICTILASPELRKMSPSLEITVRETSDWSNRDVAGSLKEFSRDTNIRSMEIEAEYHIGTDTRAYISIKLGSNEAIIRLSDATNVTLNGVNLQVQQILIKRERPLRRFMAFMYPLFFGVSTSAILSGPLIKPDLLVQTLGLFALALGIYGVYITNHYSSVHLLGSDELPGFFKRNTDNLMISIGSTILGIVIGILLKNFGIV